MGWHFMAVAPSSLSELISFLENLPEPHILCDRNYQILAANARASDPLNLQVVVVTRSGQMILKPSSLNSKPAD